MNYKVEQTSDKRFAVKETRTEQIIESFKTQKEARDFMKRLNLGYAFDGWSPTFVLRRVAKI